MRWLLGVKHHLAKTRARVHLQIMKTAIILPARLHSERLPQKLLLAQSGKSLIQHSWERACSIPNVDQIIIATDSDDIAKICKNFGAKVIMTHSDHPSGSSRIAEAARHLDAEIIVNLQGDEPEINTNDVARLIDNHKAQQQSTKPFVSTMACPFPKDRLTGPGSAQDPSAVKVVLTQSQNNIANALYFSRSPIPYSHKPIADTKGHVLSQAYFMHIGIYVFTAQSLARFPDMPNTPLAQLENLEQLKILENGEKISVLTVSSASPGIDTQEDYDAFLLRQKRS